MRSKIAALVAALLLTTSPAFAGGGDSGDWELGIYGGYGWLDDYGILHPKDAMLYGARLGYFFTPHWNVEFSAQRLATDTEFEILGLQDQEVHLDALRLNLLYNFGAAGQSFRPFLTAGVGREMIDVENFGNSCDVGWNAGGGFRWFMTPHWNLRADGRYVGTSVDMGDDKESQGNVEATLGLGWVFGGHRTEVKETVTAPPPRNLAPTVSCVSDRAEILPGESVNLRATASDPEGDPLTYQWSATAGRVTGTGASASLNFTGTTPPATATVTVRVSDGHGNTAASDCGIRLLEPVRAAEAVSCLAGGFPQNLSRLNNVDKACLDDVAERLKADPRARVIVIGQADSHENSPDRISEQRAKAVNTYLVSERSIEASRITIRSVGATRDLGTGAASNRRVEVWFVPEGAKEPN